MLAGLHRGSHHRRSFALLTALFLASGLAFADGQVTLVQRLAAVQETIRINPQRGQADLDGLQSLALEGTAPERAEFLSLSCIAQYRLGHHDRALALCEQALAVARQAKDPRAIAKGLLAKAYALFAANDVAQAHRLVW